MSWWRAFNPNKLLPRVSIRFKLTVAFALVALGPLLAVSALGTRETLDRLEATARRTLAYDLEVAERETAAALSLATDHVVFLADSVLAPFLHTERVPAEVARERVRIASTLIATEPRLYRVKVITPDGRYVLQLGGGAPAASGTTVDGAEADGGEYYAWMGAALRPSERAFLPVELAASDADGARTLLRAIAILTPVYDGETLVGVVVGEARASRLFESLDRASAGFQGVTGLVDDRGLMLFHSERLRGTASPLVGSGPVRLEDDVPVEHAAAVTAGRVGSLRTADDRLVAYRPLGLGLTELRRLTLYRIVPLDALATPARGFLGTVLLSFPVVVLVVLLMAMVAADQFTRPIFRIREAAWRLARAETVSDLSVETNDEMEDLAIDFAEVARRVEEDRQQRQALIAERTALLERARSDLGDLLEHSADGIVITDADGRVRTWSGGAEALTGWRADEVLGRPVDALLFGGVEEAERGARAEALRTRGALVNVVTRVRAKDGTPVEVSITQTLQRDAAGGVAGSSLILRDNRERAELEQHLRRSERLAAMSVMAAGLAHEINNPLAIVGNRIEVMQREAARNGASAALRGDLEVLRSHVSRLGDLTRSLLRFAREESRPADPVALGTVAEGIVTLLRQTFAMRGLRLEHEIAPDLPAVAVDAKAIETVLVNLLLNAADATPTGGMVSLRLQARGGVVECEVTDTGPGIPLAQRERVFEPFYTTKGAGRGTGLGLAVCRTIVDRHRGAIRIDDAPGGGCRIVVSLPVAQQEGEWTRRAS